jgi:hypothetical protein
MQNFYGTYLGLNLLYQISFTLLEEITT